MLRGQSSSEHLTSHWNGQLLTAITVVVLGTALLDPARLWLLIVPASFLLAAFAAGTLVNHHIAGITSELKRPFALDLAIHLGVGIACLSLLAVLSALAGVLWLAGIGGVLLTILGLLKTVRASTRLRFPRDLLFPMLGGAVLGVAWLIAWLWVTIPPTFFDELAYHLVIPQQALATGKLLTAPWNFFTLMPHASDLLLAWGMSFGGDLGARATLFALWVTCSLSAWGMAEAIAWPRPAPWAVVLVTCALATSPMLWFHATLPFAETCLIAAVLSAAGLLSFPEPGIRRWVPLGLVLGLVATAKLSGLFWAAGLLAAALILGWSSWDTTRAALVALASVAPWWARAFYYTGNPIYPMGYNFLGGSPWSNESQAHLLKSVGYGSSMELSTLVRLPLDLVQHPERFGSASDVGVTAVIATCLVLTLPAFARALAFGPRGKRLSDGAAVFILVTGLFWVWTSRTTRYFAPSLALGLVVLVGLILHLRATAQATAAILLLIVGSFGTWRFIEQHSAAFSSMEMALGSKKTDEYLSRQLDNFAAARFVREQLPAHARLLFIGETRPYYFAREAIAPSAFDTHPLYFWVKESSSPQELAARIAAEGITHVVLNTKEFKRLHDAYGHLTFPGERGQSDSRRLRELPSALQLLYGSNQVYVFAVPPPQKE